MLDCNGFLFWCYCFIGGILKDCDLVSLLLLVLKICLFGSLCFVNFNLILLFFYLDDVNFLVSMMLFIRDSVYIDMSRVWMILVYE